MKSKKTPFNKSASIREILVKNPQWSDSKIASVVGHGCTNVLVSVVRNTEKRKARAEKQKQKKVETETKNKPIKFVPANLVIKEDEAVNHPAHYTVGGISTYDFITAKKLPYDLGNVIKYVSRADYKGSRLQDLQKAQWYLNAAIKQEKGK